jgi:threonine/homoserine/homoserine lactone efflux protein
MNLVDFIVTVVVVTASGALAPGPLSFAVLMQGSKGGALAGFSCAIGHTLVEFPLVLALALGLLAATSQPFVKSVIGVAGGIGLIVFGILQIRDTICTAPTVNQPAKRTTLPASALVLGAALTGLNPYFILWWLTIGSVLIIQALAFTALLGVLVMYVSHVWMDYAFMTALAHFGRKGEAIVGSKYYRIVLGIFGAILIYYGASFILGAI